MGKDSLIRLGSRLGYTLVQKEKLSPQGCHSLLFKAFGTEQDRKDKVPWVPLEASAAPAPLARGVIGVWRRLLRQNHTCEQVFG